MLLTKRLTKYYVCLGDSGYWEPGDQIKDIKENVVVHLQKTHLYTRVDCELRSHIYRLFVLIENNKFVYCDVIPREPTQHIPV